MKKLLSLVIAATLSLSLVACGNSQNANNNSESTSESSSESSENNSQADNNGVVAKIKEKGELVMATSPDYPPYEFKIMENGKEKIVGFDINIAEEIAKDMGVNLRVLDLMKKELKLLIFLKYTILQNKVLWFLLKIKIA